MCILRGEEGPSLGGCGDVGWKAIPLLLGVFSPFNGHYTHTRSLASWVPMWPRFLVGRPLGPSGLLDLVLRALQALRLCDPRNTAVITNVTIFWNILGLSQI